MGRTRLLSIPLVLLNVATLTLEGSPGKERLDSQGIAVGNRDTHITPPPDLTKASHKEFPCQSDHFWFRQMSERRQDTMATVFAVHGTNSAGLKHGDKWWQIGGNFGIKLN